VQPWGVRGSLLVFHRPRWALLSWGLSGCSRSARQREPGPGLVMVLEVSRARLASLVAVIPAGGSEGIRVLRCRPPRWSSVRSGCFRSLAFRQLCSPESVFSRSWCFS